MDYENIEVTIVEGLIAKEVNPFGDEPSDKNYKHLNPFLQSDAFKDDFYKWKFAEEKLRTFEIDFYNSNDSRMRQQEGGKMWWDVGQKLKAQVVEDNQIIIL